MNLSDIDTIGSFYAKHNLTLDTDLFGHYFLHDSLYGFQTPTFVFISTLEEWVLKNMEYLEANVL